MANYTFSCAEFYYRKNYEEFLCNYIRLYPRSGWELSTSPTNTLRMIRQSTPTQRREIITFSFSELEAHSSLLGVNRDRPDDMIRRLVLTVAQRNTTYRMKMHTEARSWLDTPPVVPDPPAAECCEDDNPFVLGDREKIRQLHEEIERLRSIRTGAQGTIALLYRRFDHMAPNVMRGKLWALHDQLSEYGTTTAKELGARPR